MAYWDRITSRGEVSDRRANPIALGGGMGLAGIGVVLLFTYLTGGDVLGTLLNIAVEQPLVVNQEDTSQFEGADAYETFASTVLGATTDYWNEAFSAQGKTYTPPKFVLFREATRSGCGGALAAAGPHFCPTDSTIYLDERFFEELQSRFGAHGGDVAEAYVIAHEVGHHVQNELGILDLSGRNEASVQQELQADCFAGLWAGRMQASGIFEENEFTEALNAAAAVGDDNIQKQTSGTVQRETWTHGSSEDRVAALERGYTGNGIESCM